MDGWLPFGSRLFQLQAQYYNCREISCQITLYFAKGYKTTPLWGLKYLSTPRVMTLNCIFKPLILAFSHNSHPLLKCTRLHLAVVFVHHQLRLFFSQMCLMLTLALRFSKQSSIFQMINCKIKEMKIICDFGCFYLLHHCSVMDGKVI